MDIVINIQIVGEGYLNLATRDLVTRNLAGAQDIATVSYDVGRMVGPLLQTLARQLEPDAMLTTDGIEVIE